MLTILGGSSGLSFFLRGRFSIWWITSRPEAARPKIYFELDLSDLGEEMGSTVCFPSSQGVASVVMKNCEPLVLGPALAILRVYFVCFRSDISSSNFLPHILSPPVPSPKGSPP
jgi:hypothetical protein